MRCHGNILTQKLRIVKRGLEGLQNAKFFATLLVLVMAAGIFSLSPAISSLMNNVVIRSTGDISTTKVFARSGSARDIQAAVDAVASAGGGSVYIPEGTFDFVEVGESWTDARVVIPAGVNLFGAPTARTSGLRVPQAGMNPNDQVVTWKTVLRLPWDVPRGIWFKITGSSNPNKPSRFSDIKLVGYRSINSSSTYMLIPIYVDNVVDFRVDHSYFENMGAGITTWNSRGVIDHNYLVNTNGVPEPYPGTVGYGVFISRAWGYVWENDVSKVLGKYTDYTVFIEDNYFEKWRHVTASNTGAHYVFRHNAVYHDFGYGSVDSHGWFQTKCAQGHINPPAVYNTTLQKWVCSIDGSDLEITQVGTRATEIYNNNITDAIQYYWGTETRGGAGVSFNNVFGGGTFNSSYGAFMYLKNDNQDHPEGAFVRVHDWYIWNNTILSGSQLLTIYDPNGQILLDRDYFLYAPTSFTYTPYPYPHPLTLQTTP